MSRLPSLPFLRLAPVILALFAAAPAPAAGASAGAGAPSGALDSEFRAAVQALADDSMEGRGLGTKGIGRAADWIERRLRSAGLKPAFGASYRQRFPVKVGVALAEGNRIEGLSDTSWTPLGSSSSGAFSGEIAFVGYGIDAPAIGYRELEGMDLKGRVALMLRYEPQEKDDASPFDGKRPSRWSALRYKVLQARERGAAAVVFVTGPVQDEGQDKLPALKNDGPESPAGIPVLQVKTSVASAWLARAGIDLKRFQKDVDRDLRPRSVGSTGIHLRGRVALEARYVETENVAGILPGRRSLAGEVIVVGAHYDHLGMGGERSMRPNEVAIHNGADDNASGTAAVLLAAERLRRTLPSKRDRRAIVFALFSGEEVGLAGSSFFVRNPPVPVERIAAMVNLDMVGRMRENQLIAFGTESAPEWPERIERAARVAELTVTGRGDGYGPSDQTSFYAAGVPVLHLFTGTHEDYHAPSDDPERVNAEGGAKVIRFTEALAADLAQAGGKPVVYARATSAPTMSGDSRGYGAYLGTVPDYRAMEATERGVLLADVRAGGPAERAGIRGGDRVVSIAGTRIENLYDMTYALQDHKPGETVEVRVVRGGERLALKATLGDRAAMSREGTPAAAAHAAPASPAAPAAAAPAHAPAAAPADTSRAPGASSGSWYEGRPGPDFVPRAGRPFAKRFDGERHLRDIRQLTFGGENAEAYFAPDGKRLIFQATVPGAKCDQQYVLDLETGESRLVSTGKGRTTCGYFDYPEADRIIYASTAAAGDSCPPPPDRSQGYVWAIYDTYDLWEAKPDGTEQKRITETPGYDAEATWCHRGGKLVFTSTRDGDLDLYVMDEAGGVTRLTREPGYDGGAFFSPDCSEIVWRASRPRGEALEDYKRLLARGLVRPGALEIYVMKANGTEARPVTSNGAANFCPTFLADGQRILYSSNAGSADGREFELWLVDKRGDAPERVTFSEGFDGFPHFSPDGRWVVWSSNRADPRSRETNLFLARWAD